MYPTFMIVLVESHRSITGICETNSLSDANELAGPVASEARPATVGQLSFMLGPVHTATENEAESQRSRVAEPRWVGGGHSRSKGESDRQWLTDTTAIQISSAPTLHTNTSLSYVKDIS